MERLNRRWRVTSGPYRWTLALACSVLAHVMLPTDAPAVDPPAADPQPPAKKTTADKPAFEVAKNWLRLAKEHEVWIDTKQKKVMVGGYVCLRAGQLEMFACPKHTKEHESVVAVNTPARFVHVAMLAVGAQEGKPVQYEPQYRAAQGVKVDIEVIWKDENGKQKQCKAQDWVKSLKTGGAMKTPWVFVGSAFWKDESDGQRYYYADGGEFICVSNFSTAMLDLPVQSSEANEQLMFTAFTKNIPPRGTPVQLILTPKIPAKEIPAKEKKPAEEKKSVEKKQPVTEKASGA